MQIKRRIKRKYNDSLKNLTHKEKGELADYCGVSIETLYRQIRLQGPLLARPANLGKVKEILLVGQDADITEVIRAKSNSKVKSKAA